MQPFYRRLQKFAIVFKILALIPLGFSLGYLVVNVLPEILMIIVFSAALFFFLLILLSIFAALRWSALAAVIISFLFLLRATDLLSIINLALFAIFLILIGLYLHKR